MRKSLFILSCLLLSLAVIAGKPKIGPGISPGINDGDGNTTGDNSCGTEVTLPIGLPVAGDEAEVTGENSAISNIVYTFDLSQEDGASSMNQTHSAFEKAKNMNAACVLIRIDGFAGGWDVAENIRQEIIQYDRPVMVYVNNQTIPAANFISMGADSIYTKKGSTISNKKSSVNKNAGSTVTKKQEEQAASLLASANVPSNPDDLYSSDATMNEILYKAGLGNLTVVEHKAGFSERAIDFLMNPFVLLIVLLLIGFVMRKAVTSKLPGPVIYLLALALLLYLAPFQLSGLANGVEIIASIALIIAVIASARYDKRLLSGLFLISLTLVFALVRSGDTDAILRYGTFSEILTITSMPIGLVVLGWWIGKIGERKKVREEKIGQVCTSLANAA